MKDQKDLSRLGRQVQVNLMKYNRDKCKDKVFHLGQINPQCWYRFGTDFTESNLAEKNLGILVDENWT